VLGATEGVEEGELWHMLVLDDAQMPRMHAERISVTRPVLLARSVDTAP
jgi:hypothetical protein